MIRTVSTICSSLESHPRNTSLVYPTHPLNHLCCICFAGHPPQQRVTMVVLVTLHCPTTSARRHSRLPLHRAWRLLLPIFPRQQPKVRPSLTSLGRSQ